MSLPVDLLLQTLLGIGNMKLNINDVGGEVVKDNETYVLKDNKTLKNLVLSSTMLKPNQSTRGHSHPGQEEVYYFVSGQGTMQLGEDSVFVVEAGDVVLVPDGDWHRVFNMNPEPLYFVCVFDGKRNH
jgi:mannose-6-phosphate isomerase-like protein (cupin superfamily)